MMDIQRNCTVNAPPVANSQVKRLDTLSRVYLWVYIFSFAFDFKGKVGGSTIQFVYAGLALVSAIGFIFVSMQRRFRRKTTMAGVMRLWWFYLLSTLLTAVIAQVEWGRYIRVIFPIVLAGISLLIVREAAARNINPFELIRPLIFAGVLSIIFRAFYAVYVAGIDIAVMRYQILSPATPFFIGYAAWLVFEQRRPRLVPLVGIIASIIVIALSVTRTFLLSISALAIGFIMLSAGDKIVRNMNRVLMLGILVLALISGLIIATSIRPDLSEIWALRLFHLKPTSGEDITLLTRLAEYSGQWHAVTSNLISLLFGKGVGSTFMWDQAYNILLAAYVPKTQHYGDISAWYSGHSMWMYSMYSGGILFGWIVPLTFIWGLSYSYVLASRSKTIPNVHWRRYATLPFFLFLPYFAQTFVRNNFVERYEGLILGILIGLSFWLHSTVTRKIKTSKFFRAPHTNLWVES